MSAYPELQHPILTDLLSRLDACQREAYEERAGILVFEAGVDRGLAEALALLDLIRVQPMALSGVTVLLTRTEKYPDFEESAR